MSSVPSRWTLGDIAAMTVPGAEPLLVIKSIKVRTSPCSTPHHCRSSTLTSENVRLLHGSFHIARCSPIRTRLMMSEGGRHLTET